VPGEVLVVPVRGRCALRAGDVHARVASGELRLCTGGRLSLEVEAAGLAVVGSVASG
jgi:hypothetical protein